MILDRKSFSPERIREISMMLRRAFMEDPFYKYIMPNERSRLKQLDWWMICLVRYGWEYGQINMTGEPITGAAIWLKPEKPLIHSIGMARMGMIWAPRMLGIRGFARMLEVSNEWEHLHEKESPHHWYLMVLGVDPPYQGRGIGSSLMQPVLERADQDGISCYIETMTQKDVGFYRKRGFNIVVKGQVGDCIPYWTMRRSPQAQKSR
jgi:ribosomal protein S18 acetylase RimI-like enzyme